MDIYEIYMPKPECPGEKLGRGEGKSMEDGLAGRTPMRNMPENRDFNLKRTGTTRDKHD